jgi:hypothetical protein
MLERDRKSYFQNIDFDKENIIPPKIDLKTYAYYNYKFKINGRRLGRLGKQRNTNYIFK